LRQGIAPQTHDKQITNDRFGSFFSFFLNYFLKKVPGVKVKVNADFVKKKQKKLPNLKFFLFYRSRRTLAGSLKIGTTCMWVFAASNHVGQGWFSVQK
jgi:hypothetical protein